MSKNLDRLADEQMCLLADDRSDVNGVEPFVPPVR